MADGRMESSAKPCGKPPDAIALEDERGITEAAPVRVPGKAAGKDQVLEEQGDRPLSAVTSLSIPAATKRAASAAVPPAAKRVAREPGEPGADRAQPGATAEAEAAGAIAAATATATAAAARPDHATQVRLKLQRLRKLRALLAKVPPGLGLPSRPADGRWSERVAPPAPGTAPSSGAPQPVDAAESSALALLALGACH